MFSNILKASKNGIPIGCSNSMKNYILCKPNDVCTTPNPQAYSSIVNTKENPGRVVFISQSLDVYSNLAFEDWLYKNWNFCKRNVLFLWRNSPCVVIGRHQNPYMEANLDYLDIAGIPLVRRNSGGGTVYHDEGNINFTFFTSRERYNRRANLKVITSALQKDFNIPAGINKKDDIVIGNDHKISGTAAKLGRLSAYHHCTLLVSSDKQQIGLALKGDKTLHSKSTKSVPSSVTNLQEICPNLTVEKVIGNIGRAFLNGSGKYATTFDSENIKRTDGFALINPTEEWFPGIDSLKSKLQSWDWVYGMTPLFKQTRPVALDSSFSEGSSVLISVEVFHGIIKAVRVESNVGQVLREHIENRLGRDLVGVAYSPDFFSELESQIAGGLRDEKKVQRFAQVSSTNLV